MSSRLVSMCFALLPLFAGAQTLTVRADSIIVLPPGSIFKYKQLVLERNSSLIIPEETRALTIQADYFVAEEGSRIYQYFPNRALRGGQGGPGSQPGYGEKGMNGSAGEKGRPGIDGVDLTLRLGIAKLDQMSIFLGSQAGGHGGKGGKGGLGGAPSCSTERVDGGDGGTGGPGGAGGAAGAVGPVRFIWWPVKGAIPSYASGHPVGLSVVLQPGAPGWGGAPGDGGDGIAGKNCDLMADRNGGRIGVAGVQGPGGDTNARVRPVHFERLEIAL
jgi:hypothetical protein